MADRRRRGDVTVVKPPTHEDGLHAEIMGAMRKAAVDALKPLLEENPHRLLRTLSIGDVDGLTVAVQVAYVRKRDELEKREALRADFNDDLDDILPLTLA